jgi:hypothetical protein
MEYELEPSDPTRRPPGVPHAPVPDPYGSQPPHPWGAPFPPRRQKRGMPTWVKALIILAVVLGIGLVALCGGLGYLAGKAPPTYVQSGQQIREVELDVVHDLGLLEPGERILYFYSDGLLGPEEGMYFITDQRLVCYCNAWSEPLTSVPYESIIDVRAEYEPSVFIDSMVYVTYVDGEYEMDLVFPVSSERGGDQRFVNELRERVELADHESQSQ